MSCRKTCRAPTHTQTLCMPRAKAQERLLNSKLDCHATPLASCYTHQCAALRVLSSGARLMANGDAERQGEATYSSSPMADAKAAAHCRARNTAVATTPAHQASRPNYPPTHVQAYTHTPLNERIREHRHASTTVCMSRPQRACCTHTHTSMSCSMHFSPPSSLTSG